MLERLPNFDRADLGKREQLIADKLLHPGEMHASGVSEAEGDIGVALVTSIRSTSPISTMLIGLPKAMLHGSVTRSSRASIRAMSATSVMAGPHSTDRECPLPLPVKIHHQTAAPQSHKALLH